MVQRITTERDAARAAAEAALKVDKAYEHFRGKSDISDPYGLAKFAVPSIPEWGDDYTTKLDAWYDQQKSFFGGSGAPPAEEPPSSDNTPSPSPNVVPPGMSPSAPSPAGGGGQPLPEPLTWESPEVKAAREKGDYAALKTLVSSDRFQPHPLNERANRARQE